MNVIVNGETRECGEACTVARLLAELRFPTRGIAVEVNEQIVPQARHETYELHGGDRIELVSLAGGG